MNVELKQSQLFSELIYIYNHESRINKRPII